MSKYEDFTNELLTKLYEAKTAGMPAKQAKSIVIDLITKGQSGMVEVIKDLNNLGYIKITILNGQRDHYFLRLDDDYLTLKGEEYYENKYSINNKSNI